MSKNKFKPFKRHTIFTKKWSYEHAGTWDKKSSAYPLDEATVYCDGEVFCHLVGADFDQFKDIMKAAGIKLYKEKPRIVYSKLDERKCMAEYCDCRNVYAGNCHECG